MGTVSASKGFPALVFVGVVVVILAVAIVGGALGWWPSLIETDKAGTSTPSTAADRAMKALRREEAATDVGINQPEYNSRVADVKAEVDNVTQDIER